MALDQYQLCPCGSGKKVKFCCSRDIVHELDRIERMIQGEQRLAAIDKIDALLAKHPDRPSLLMTRVEVELALKEYGKARATVNRLLEVDRQNPSVLALPAILDLALEGNIPKAINNLQIAFMAVDGVVTNRVYEAVMLVAMSLLNSGLPVAAKGHLQLALALSDAKDERCTSALMQLNHNRSIPLLLREALDLEEAPADVTWKIEFEATMSVVFRGRWAAGAQRLSDMASRILDAPAILKNLGVLNAWLGRNDEACRSFRSYSRIRDVPMDKRIHAESLSQLLDPDTSKSSLEVIQKSFEVKDMDRLMEKCLSSDRLIRMPDDAEQAERGAPPPKGRFEVLDGPKPADDDVDVSHVPRVLAALVIFGRQTDQEARLILNQVRSDDEVATGEFVAELFGDTVGADAKEAVVGRASRSNHVVGAWHIPERASLDVRRRMAGELRYKSLFERWPNMPSPLYDGKTPTEAAKESQFKIPLLAELLISESSLESTDGDLSDLRRQLDLPDRGPLSAEEINIDVLPVHDFDRLDIPSLSNEQLLSAYRRAYSVMAVRTLREIALVLIERPGLDQKIDKVEAYDILSDVAATTDESLMFLEKARKLATAEGESPAQWLIDELELRLLRGEFEIFARLIKEIESRYIKEPGVAPTLLQMLSRYGLVTPDGRMMMPMRKEMAQSPEAESVAAGVWTSDSDDSSPPASDEPKSESKLWVPGMD